MHGGSIAWFGASNGVVERWSDGEVELRAALMQGDARSNSLNGLAEREKREKKS